MSEEYQVIARKYRPMRFADVVGQQHVIRTLKNAIEENRTAHAYLLVGPRGIGKTTLARIFAKALNCENPEDGEPCCKCRSCLAIAEDSSFDVIEIDAASRNSVGEMRDLTDEIMHMPAASRYKIYIIDEIHMLSNAAWNALLKTVEEPPAHVKFIFATTEVHKVLATIISRCQRFDLLPIPSRLIAERLRFIAEDQKIKIDSQALEAIARAADGGMRDAQSLLDQMIAFFGRGGDKGITAAEVLSLFGLTDAAELSSLVKAILLNQAAEVVGIIAALSRKGKNLETLFDDILNAVRAIELCLLLKNPGEVLEETPEVIARYRELAEQTTSDKVQSIMETLSPVGFALRNALNKQVFLETVLLKAMREANSIKVADLIARLNQLRAAGELKFVDSVPAAIKQEAASGTHLPPTIIKTPVVIPLPEEGDDSKAAATGGSINAIDFASPKAEGLPEKSPQEIFSEFLADLRKSGFDSDLTALLERGTAESSVDGTLQASFALSVSSKDFAKIEAANKLIQQAYQNFSGDWASSLKLIRPVEVEPPPQSEEPLPEVTDMDMDDEIEDGGDFEGIVDGDTLSQEDDVPLRTETLPPSGGLNKVLEALQAGKGAAVESKNATWTTVMNRPGALDDSKADVQDILDLFGGSIIDIHEKKKQ